MMNLHIFIICASSRQYTSRSNLYLTCTDIASLRYCKTTGVYKQVMDCPITLWTSIVLITLLKIHFHIYFAHNIMTRILSFCNFLLVLHVILFVFISTCHFCNNSHITCIVSNYCLNMMNAECVNLYHFLLMFNGFVLYDNG